MPGYTESSFMQGMIKEDFSNYAGINQTLSENTLIQKNGVYTDFSDGISYRNRSISSDGFGFGRLPFPVSVAGSIFGSRGMGIFQSPYATAPTWQNLYTYFSSISAGTQTTSIEQWQMSQASNVFSAPTNIASYTTGTAPTPGLLCHSILNGRDILADADRFYRFTPGTTPVYSPMLVQPTTPTLSDVSQAGILNGFYAYCITLIDANNNESLPSALVASASLTLKKPVVSVTLASTGGTDALANGWTKIRLYRTLTNGLPTATTALNGQVSLPQGTLTVVDTTGFAGTGSVIITVSLSPLVQQTVTYTGTTATTFTGCTGGTGVIPTGASVVSVGQTATAVAASQNPLFYHVQTSAGATLDITLTPGTNSYTFAADNNDDYDISTGVTYYPLALGGIQKTEGNPVGNVTYFNGALQALTSGVPAFATAWQNRILASKWYGISGTNYKNRLYWNDLQDNSQTSTGNTGAWHALSFLDFDATDGSEIIGQYPGLQGRFYVFKNNGTIVLQATGNSATPFLPVKIDAEYGLYHFSCAEVGSQVMGRTRDGIAMFNGTTFKHISAPIRDFLNTCIYPEGDSGVYDFSTQRYYLSVCTTTIPGSYDMIDSNGNNNLLYCARNAVICYDMNSGTWEIHLDSPIQYFVKIRDNFLKEKIFAVGESSDIFATVLGNLYGSTLSFVCTQSGDELLSQGPSWPSSVVGKRAFIIAFYSGSNIFSLSDWSSIITGIDGSNPTAIVLSDPLPFQGNNADKYLVMISNNTGTITAKDTTSLTDSANYFQVHTNGYNFAFQSPTVATGDTLFFNKQGEGLTSTTKLTLNNSATWSITSGNLYQIVPMKAFGGTVNQNTFPYPYYRYMTPPFGYSHDSAFKKKFNQFYLSVKGNGVLRIKTYLEGTPSSNLISGTGAANQTLLLTIPSATQFKQKFVHLNGITGNWMRVEFAMVKGSGWFEINEFGMRYRRLGQLRNA